MTEEVKRFNCELNWDGTQDTGAYQVAEMEQAPEGKYVTYDDYVAMIQKFERAQSASDNYALLLQQAANALGIPANEKIVPALIPAIHSIRASLTEKLAALDVKHGGFIVMTYGHDTNRESLINVAEAISRATHNNVAILKDGDTITALSVDDMGAAGWVRKE